MKKKIIVLGASGSIGKNTLTLIKKFPDRFTLVAFSVHTNLHILEEIHTEFPNACACVTGLQNACFTYCGDEGLRRMIQDIAADIVVNGIAGMPGLRPSIDVIASGKHLALANKESLVMAGSLLKHEAEKQGVKILPVDSEHAAVFQLLDGIDREHVLSILLTASGGPFRTAPYNDLKHITVEQACAHPTWKMGKKISIDSASMANKALEIIEAVQLFDISPDRISVVVHPQSIIHSMVQTVSGETYAQLSLPNMQNPILFALAYPDSPPHHLKPLDLTTVQTLTFEKPRYEDFPLLGMGFQAAKKGGAYSIAFNAANEQAVFAFMQQRISFLTIPKIVGEVLEYDWTHAPSSFDEVFETDQRVRIMSDTLLRSSL